MGARELAIGDQEIRVVGDSLLQQPYGLAQIFWCPRIEGQHLIKVFGAQVTVVGDKIRRWGLLNCRFFCRRKFCLQLVGNRSRDVCLNCKDIVKRSIITFRPQMPVTPRINQLRSDANTVAGRLYASFYNVRYAELVCDFPQVSLHACLVLHDGRAADHFQIGDLRQIGENFVLDGIGEKGVVRICAQTLKRQYCDTLFERWRLFGSRDRRW